MTLIVIETEEGSVSSIEEPPLTTLGAPSPSNQDIFSSPLLPHTKHQRQSLRPPFSGRQHILHCGASLDAAHMLYGAGHPCTIRSPPKPTNVVQLVTIKPKSETPWYTFPPETYVWYSFMLPDAIIHQCQTTWILSTIHSLVVKPALVLLSFSTLIHANLHSVCLFIL